MSPSPDQELRSILSGTGSPDPAVLLELAPRLPEAQLPRALEIALDVRYPAMDLRAHLVEVLAQRIVKADPGTIREALGVARANLLRTKEGTEAALVRALAPVIAEDLLPVALQVANHIPHLAERINALAALAARLPPEDAEAVLGSALETARGFEYEIIVVDRLLALVPHLPESLLSKSLEMALKLKDAGNRLQILTALVQYLSGEEQRTAIDAALSAILSYKEPLWQAQALEDLEPYLSEADQVENALAAAGKIHDKYIRIQALVLLAGRLAADERPKRAIKWEKTARQLQGLHEKAASFAGIAPLLPAEKRPAALVEILEMVRSLRTVEAPNEDNAAVDWRYPDVRALGLLDLAAGLPEQERTEVLKEALQDVQAVPDPDWSAQMLASITELLPKPPPFTLEPKLPVKARRRSEGRSQVMRQINSALRHIQEEPGYIDEVVYRLDSIPAGKRGRIVSQIVDALKAIQDEYMLREKIILLAPYLEEVHLEQILSLARNIKDPSLRSRALVALARRFPQTGQPPLVDEALAAIESLEDAVRYANRLGELAPVLSETQKSEALQIALERMRSLRKSMDQASIIWALADYFPADLLPQAWMAAMHIRAREYRASALAVLAPFVPPEDRAGVLGDALEAILALEEKDASYHLEELALILPERLLRRAVAAAQQFKDDLRRADALSALLAELAGYASGEERRSILRAALQEALRAAVPRGGGKKGRSDPEVRSEAGVRASQLLQNLPESEGQALLEAWLGPLSAETQKEMASLGKGASQKKHAKPPEHQPTQVELVNIGSQETEKLGVAVDKPKPTTQTRVVNTGFALGDQPDQRLSGETPLAAGGSYYFWLDVDKLDALSIETQPTSLPVELETQPALLRVVLFAFPNEIGLTPGADIGELELQVDGSAVVKRQPGGQAAPLQERGLLKTRLYFPVQTPDREGTFRLRCHIYYEQILIQARIIEAVIMRSPQETPRALQSRLDYSLAQSLRPEHLTRLPPHRLSLMLNDNGDTTHTLRFFSDREGDPKKYDAHLLPTELEIPMLNARKALWKISWGSENPWDPGLYPGQKYRYEDNKLDAERLEKDLIGLAVSGYILYNAIIDKLTGGRTASYELADLMRLPGLVQIAMRQSPSQVLPAALFYDYDLDTQADHVLCETFKAALVEQTPLENTACFQGACPSLNQPGADRMVCPSGFWGFRHWLGMPFSAAPGTDQPPEIVVHGEPQMVVGVATNLDLVDEHLQALQGIRADLGWHETEHRDEILDMMKDVKPHLIYFYCHGGVANDVPFLQVGSGNEYIEGSNLRSKHIYWDTPQPLIFVNGCHTTALDPRQVISLVQDFIATGGAGVLGTEITVFETLAVDFAEEFLVSFLKLHASTGEAVRCARLKLLEKGNPLGLVYTPYVLPSLHLLE